MAADSTLERNGNEKGGGCQKEKKVSSGSIHTARDLANANLRNALGVLNGTIGTRQATAATSGFREARILLTEGQKIGYTQRFFDVNQPARDHYSEQEEILLAELKAQQAEAEVKQLRLETQLKTIREQRNAENVE
jgi:hypothetical protein